MSPAGETVNELPVRRAFLSALDAERSLQAAREQAARELAGYPIAATSPRLTWARAEAFLAEARGFRRIDAEVAWQAAMIAEVVARQLDPADFPPGAVTQLQADCGVEVANALRIAGDLPGAEKVFHRAGLAAGEANGR